MNTYLIKKNFFTANYITLCSMYLKEYKKFDEINVMDLKSYNPGHLGSSIGINFLLSNLNYFINKNNLKSKTVIGTGHSGVSLLSNLWLNGTLSEYYDNYSITKEGLNNLIEDFGMNIRSEINPEYPGVIYDGGELGYSLSHAYGYAINTEADLIPCIIGDGEAETGTLSSSWYLNKMLKTKSKVLPIINLNKYKMGSNSYLSKLTNEELINYYTSLGYNVKIIDTKDYGTLESLIDDFQLKLDESLNTDSPLIIFKSPKGFTIPDTKIINVEDNTSSHKNPLINFDKFNKLNLLKDYLEKFYYDIFDEKNELENVFIKCFHTTNINDCSKDVDIPNINNLNLTNKNNIEHVEEFLLAFLKQNNSIVFSPDEIYSNKLGKVDKYCFEILNENVLQGLLEGYTEAGNSSMFIGYEGFMPLVTSMISQRYKYLLQRSKTNFKLEKNSLNYILTSICWENTYSHQNPEFVNGLLVKNDKFYNVLYPKDGISFIKCMEESLQDKDKINIITMSKREEEKYSNYDESNTRIDVVNDVLNPDIILCATGDYMLKQIKNLTKELLKNRPSLKIKIVYITNPKILDINSIKTLTQEEFNNYFNCDNVLYLFNGYPNIIKSLLYERQVNFKVLGYNDQISTFGGINENLNNNGLGLQNLLNICYDVLDNKEKNKKLNLRRKDG